MSSWIPRGGSENTRLILRKEANFGYAKCGEPYLTYHHFDPAWAEETHDNPEGMIALCAKHANAADGGAYTKKYLKNLKKHPLLQDKTPSAYFEWAHKGFLFIIGGNIGLNIDTIVKYKDNKMIWMEEDEDLTLKMLSMDLYDQYGSIFLSMRKNQWTSDLTKVDDIDSSYRGQRLKVVAKNNSWFQIKCTSIKMSDLEQYLKRYTTSEEIIQKTLTDCSLIFKESAAICTLNGEFFLNNSIVLNEKEMIINHGIRFKGSQFGSGTLIHFQ